MTFVREAESTRSGAMRFPLRSSRIQGELKILTMIVCLAMQLIVVGISIYWIASYTGSFQNLAAKNYPWSMPNRVETQFLPFAAVSVGFILNLGMTVIAWIWRWRNLRIG
jgi:hypothetical protein